MSVPACKEAGAGPPLVFLHGIGGNRHSFDGQLAHFSRDWRALAWDMPGYGGTPLPAEMTWPVLTDSLAELFDAARIGRAVVVGHSMGGMVAQSFIASHPARVSALVLSGTSPAFGKPGGDWQREFLAARLKPLDEGKTPADLADGLVESMFGSHKDPAAMRKAAACMAAVPAETYRAALHCLVAFDGRADLPNIACPTLVLAGENDVNAPPAVMERMAAKIPGAVYSCMPGVGHLANFERPDLFNAALDGFLSTLEA